MRSSEAKLGVSKGGAGPTSEFAGGVPLVVRVADLRPGAAGPLEPIGQLKNTRKEKVSERVSASWQLRIQLERVPFSHLHQLQQREPIFLTSSSPPHTRAEEEAQVSRVSRAYLLAFACAG